MNQSLPLALGLVGTLLPAAVFGTMLHLLLEYCDEKPLNSSTDRALKYYYESKSMEEESAMQNESVEQSQHSSHKYRAKRNRVHIQRTPHDWPMAENTSKRTLAHRTRHEGHHAQWTLSLDWNDPTQQNCAPKTISIDFSNTIKSDADCWPPSTWYWCYHAAVPYVAESMSKILWKFKYSV